VVALRLEPAESSLRASIRTLPGHLTPSLFGTAIVAWFFAVSGPLLILLNAARQGNLSSSEVERWIFAGYGLGGIMTLLLSLRYRQPITVAWSISGCGLVGAFLGHWPLSYAIGVYFLAGVLSLLLGVTGWFKRVWMVVPLPIVLGMVSAILLPLGIGVVTAARAQPTYGGGAVAIFFIASRSKRLSRFVPPIVLAIVGGGVLAAATGAVHWGAVPLRLVDPAFGEVTFSLSATLELLVPLTLTMVVVQDAQSFAILKALGYRSPPVNAAVTATGIGTLLGAAFGSHSCCTAPVMIGIVGADPITPREGRYAGAIIVGLLFLPFAVFSPTATAITRAFPPELIQILGGLALLPVLSASLGQAFGSTFRMGAVIAFVVTLSGISIGGVGSPFWGLIAGCVASFVLERLDFAQLRNV
jgi:benzoate membrane transport protein